MVKNQYDAVIIGSGPNGLSAGICLAKEGMKVLIIEANQEIGGGTRTKELTLPGFHHDVCSAVHPFGFASPFFKSLNLEQHGLEWIFPEASVAHPLDNQDAVMLYQSIEKTAEALGADQKTYQKLMAYLTTNREAILSDSLGPLQFPKNSIPFLRFGINGLWPLSIFSKFNFKEDRLKALFAGCAAHSTMPLNKFFTTAVGLVFLMCGHEANWPIAKGGSFQITKALAKIFKENGGEIEVSTRINNYDQLPKSKYYLFDTDPLQMIQIAKDQLPGSYKKRIQKFNFGPGIFKVDYALSESIPWKDSNCLKASTVHVGGNIEEIAASEKLIWNGKISENPFVLVSQQSEFDESRAPKDSKTLWAYCHVPFGSTKDMKSAIENQVERFAPGFKDIILAKSSINSKELHHYNPNYVGGSIGGGAADITQLFFRPLLRRDPYSTPNPNIYICSASSPPGGGVHGMCGYWAAQSVFKNWKK